MASSSNVACVWGANGISGVAMINVLRGVPPSEIDLLNGTTDINENFRRYKH